SHRLVHPRYFPSFPTRRSSDLLLVLAVLEHRAQRDVDGMLVEVDTTEGGESFRPIDGLGHARRLVELERAQALHRGRHLPGQPLDRKSTRLNSSHEWISYAVFC